MFLQNLFCCGSCSIGQDAFQGLGSNSKTEASTNLNKITNKIQLYTAIVRIGEIIKLNKVDKFPSLEVSIEMENDKIKPDAEFVYLHDIRNDLEEIQEENKYSIEMLEWAENIGKTYILLDFDKTQKYKIFYMKKVMDNNKKATQKGGSTAGGSIQPEKRKAILRYEILGQSPAFSVQASINNRDITENSYLDTNNCNSVSTISPPMQEEFIRRKKPNGQANSMQIPDQKQFDALNESDMDPAYENYGSLNGIRKKYEDNERGKFTDSKNNENEGNRVLQNYNPMTKTYFKCSLYSPSNRLFTVDEVNSNFSGNDQLSQNNLSGYHRNLNHLNVASYQGSFRCEDMKSEHNLKISNSLRSLSVVTPMMMKSESQSEVTSGQCISDLNSVEMTASEQKQYFSKKSSISQSGRGSPFSINNQIQSHNEEAQPRMYELEAGGNGDTKDKENFVSSARQSVPQKSSTTTSSTANQSQNVHWFLKRNNSYTQNKSSTASSTASQKKVAPDTNFISYYNEVAQQLKEKDKKKAKIPFNYDSKPPINQINKFSLKATSSGVQTLSSKNRKPSLQKFE